MDILSGRRLVAKQKKITYALTIIKMRKVFHLTKSFKTKDIKFDQTENYDYMWLLMTHYLKSMHAFDNI